MQRYGLQSSYDHRDNVIAYLEQIGFAENIYFPKNKSQFNEALHERSPSAKKGKIGDRGVTLSIRQETIKNLPKAPIPPSNNLLCLRPNQNDF